MALEATHIRFALDLKDKYQVKDIERYVSGTIYPDSRYVTEIDRLLTHPTGYMDWDIFKVDDFKKGWLVHLLCDKVQYLTTKEELPEIFEGQTGQGSEVWVRHTAIKILQDIDDVKQYSIKTYLPCLNYVENPNGENLDKVKQYNQIFLKMYENPDTIDIESCYKMWKEFGIGDELATQVKLQAEAYQNNEHIMKTVKGIYSKMLAKI